MDDGDEWCLTTETSGDRLVYVQTNDCRFAGFQLELRHSLIA